MEEKKETALEEVNNTINNISNDIILSMVYEYIVNNDEFKL